MADRRGRQDSRRVHLISQRAGRVSQVLLHNNFTFGLLSTPSLGALELIMTSSKLSREWLVGEKDLWRSRLQLKVLIIYVAIHVFSS